MIVCFAKPYAPDSMANPFGPAVPSILKTSLTMTFCSEERIGHTQPLLK